MEREIASLLVSPAPRGCGRIILLSADAGDSIAQSGNRGTLETAETAGRVLLVKPVTIRFSAEFRSPGVGAAQMGAGERRLSTR
jgi:hypothetical protein